MSQKFCNSLIHPRSQFKSWKVPVQVVRIVLVGALICCTFLLCLRDLKAATMILQRSLIWELMLYEIELGHKAAEASIYGTKSNGAIDHSTVTRWFKRFYSGCKDLNHQIRLSRPKSMDSVAMFQAIKTNSTESIRRAQHLTIVCD